MILSRGRLPPRELTRSMSEAVRLRVRVLFEQAVAGGLAPNEAVAQALQTAQEEAFAQAAERRVAAVASEL